ncbi:transglutaminase family protein [Marimonas sp. MJW-29]|uniref:Transglutaminase family protein n=1 Tax=Sulfitobacter sediminis TaxID=3234186 RepID=A0ABV3RU48_9RHOB
MSTDGIFRDTGLLDPTTSEAAQHAVQDLLFYTLFYLLGSRYCDTDLLSEEAWRRFEKTPPGWTRVQAICDFVHSAVSFDYMQASATRTAYETLAGRQGVCRDFAHLAIALCRCMNIPARYCTGYLSEFGQSEPHPPDDFAAWMEVFLGGRWWVFDPRNNRPRIGRILIARGRDAADVPLTQTFGLITLTQFDVWTDELTWPWFLFRLGIVNPVASPHIHNTNGKGPGPTWTRSCRRSIKGSMTCLSRT